MSRMIDPSRQPMYVVSAHQTGYKSLKIYEHKNKLIADMAHIVATYSKTNWDQLQPRGPEHPNLMIGSGTTFSVDREWREVYHPYQ